MIAVSSAHDFGKCKKSEHDVEKKTEFRLRYFTVQTEQARPTSCLLYGFNKNFWQSPWSV